MSFACETAWRLCRQPYADLSGLGAQKFGARWNSPGRAAVYVSTEPALPVLEVLVHLDLPLDLLPSDYVLMRVDLRPLGDPGQAIEDARHIDGAPGTARAFGDRWLADQRTPVLRVRSQIVAEASNLIINPAHPASAALHEPATRPFAFDPRLFAR